MGYNEQINFNSQIISLWEVFHTSIIYDVQKCGPTRLQNSHCMSLKYTYMIKIMAMRASPNDSKLGVASCSSSKKSRVKFQGDNKFRSISISKGLMYSYFLKNKYI